MTGQRPLTPCTRLAVLTFSHRATAPVRPVPARWAIPDNVQATSALPLPPYRLHGILPVHSADRLHNHPPTQTVALTE